MGYIGTSLAASAADRWYRHDTVDVVLLNPSMWLESRSEAGVLAGANFALIGDELVQFTTAIALSAGRFQLGGWLRGRRGSVVGDHAIGERFVVIDPLQLTPFDPPIEAIGSSLRFKAVGPMDHSGLVRSSDVVVKGNSLRPLAPVQLHASRNSAGDIAVCWTRCSRSGFAWLDSVDAPVAEEREAYHVNLVLDARSVVSADVSVPLFTYPAAAFAAVGGSTAVNLSVRVS